MKIEDRRTGQKREIGELKGGQVFKHHTCPGLWLLSDGKATGLNLDDGTMIYVSTEDKVFPGSGKFVIEDGPR